MLHLQPERDRAHATTSRPASPIWRDGRWSASRTRAKPEAFDAVAASNTATYRETVDALGPNFEGGYFLYRFSDPTYIVAHAVMRSVAKTVLEAPERGERSTSAADRAISRGR